MNESYDLSLRCKRPGICVSGILCENTKTHGCCWHEDKRKNKNVIYVDGYGDIDPTAFSLASFGLTVPQDIHYCPSCKVTKETLGEIIERITKVLPSPEEYQRMLTLEQKRKKEKERIASEKIRAREKIIAAKKAHEDKKKNQDRYPWLYI